MAGMGHTELVAEVDRLTALANELTLRCILAGAPLPEGAISAKEQHLQQLHEQARVQTLMPWAARASSALRPGDGAVPAGASFESGAAPHCFAAKCLPPGL
jgi:hypothetical protein